MYEMSYDGTARAVAEAWSEALNDKVTSGDDLLAMGAHSLMMAMVANRLEDELHVTVPLELCFEAPLFDDYAAEVHRLRCAAGPVTDRPD